MGHATSSRYALQGTNWALDVVTDEYINRFTGARIPARDLEMIDHHIDKVKALDMLASIYMRSRQTTEKVEEKPKEVPKPTINRNVLLLLEE